MKTKILLWAALVICAALSSCEDENQVTDPVYEFVSFAGQPAVNLNEGGNSTNAYPVVVKLWAFDAPAQDIDLGLEVTGSNTQENVDFVVTPASSVKIKAGKMVSDTIWIKTIDNLAGTDLVRTFNIKITTVSKSDVKIGLGLASPKNNAITFTILDDECSNTTAIYNTTLSNNIDGTIKPATGVVNADKVTLTGNLIDYSPFSGATLTITLTPNSPGATKGKATFGEQEAGTDNDGWAYKFVQVGEGTYDVCSKTISIEYDIYYEDGGWVYWYSVTNVFSAP
ncbi:MAG: hypothetical protein ACOYXT_14130 [Bacteroidota bacterium]